MKHLQAVHLAQARKQEQADGHDNYIRTLEVVDPFRIIWDNGGDPGVSVAQLFTYLADQSYLGLRLRSLGKVDSDVSLDEVYERYVAQAEPLEPMSDEEFPVDV